MKQRGDSLSPRQVDALMWLANGKTQGEAADLMGVHRNTFDGYLNQARERLGAHTTTGAVVAAIKRGIIPL